MIVELTNELNSLIAIECDLLYSVKDNENTSDETLCTNNISNFLSSNFSVSMSETLPGGNNNELKDKMFSYYKMNLHQTLSNQHRPTF